MAGNVVAAAAAEGSDKIDHPRCKPQSSQQSLLFFLSVIQQM